MQLLQSELDDVRPQSDRCLGEKSYQGRINDRQPFGVLTTAELLSEVKNATRTRSQRVETYNYQGSREHSDVVEWRTGTYGLFVVVQDYKGPCDVNQRAIPVLHDDQARYDFEYYWGSYSDE